MARMFPAAAVAIAILTGAASDARAVTIRVDWSALAVPQVPLDSIPVAGSFGTFEVASFPAVLPLSFPFGVSVAFGPDPGLNTYTFTSASRLAFEFLSPTEGSLLNVPDDVYGSARASIVQCSVGTPETYCPSGTSWGVELSAVANSSYPDSVQLSLGSLHSGYTYYWQGPLAYRFTTVPEPGTASLLLLGLAPLVSRLCSRR